MSLTLCPPRYLRVIGTGVFAGLMLLGVPLQTLAQGATCLQDVYGKNLQCTANDVQLGQVVPGSVVDPTDSTKQILNCVDGSYIDFVATFHVITTATARENVGIYFAKDGQVSALTGGTCSDNILSPTHNNPAIDYTAHPNAPVLGEPNFVSGSSTPGYEELDTTIAGDTCGDISTADNNQLIKIYVQHVKCQAGANGMVALPYCTSWQQPGGVNKCVATQPGWGYPYNTNGALPGSPSKCDCDNTFTIPVVVQKASLTVAKTCKVGTMTTGNSVSCAFDGTNGTQVEGGLVTYGLSITNTSNTGSLIVDQACDSYYGPLYTRAGYTPPSGQCGTAKTLASNTCDSTTIGTIDGTASTCTFQANVGELANIPDTITVYGHGDATPDTEVSKGSNQITVTSGELASALTLTSGVQSPSPETTFCGDVTYTVQAANSGATDESPLTLTGLSESSVPLGDITSVHDNVLATSCTKTSGVIASLAIGSPAYTCAFRTNVCGTIHTVTVTAGVCTSNTCTAGDTTKTSCTQNSDCDLTCSGISQSITVGATAYGDEGSSDTLPAGQITGGGKTAVICVQQATAH